MEYIWIGLIVIFIILIAIMFISTINEVRAERMRNMDFNISCKRIEGQLRKNGINIDSYNLSIEEKLKWEQDDTPIVDIVEEFRKKHYTEEDIKSILSHYDGKI
jgi:hypothetical protein